MTRMEHHSLQIEKAAPPSLLSLPRAHLIVGNTLHGCKPVVVRMMRDGERCTTTIEVLPHVITFKFAVKFADLSTVAFCFTWNTCTSDGERTSRGTGTERRNKQLASTCKHNTGAGDIRL